MERLDDGMDLIVLLFLGGTIVLALIFGDKGAPTTTAAPAPSSSYSYSYQDNSTNVCVGWCPGGSR